MENQKQLNVKLPRDSYDQIRVLAMLHNKSLRETIIAAVEYYSMMPQDQIELKNLRNKVYRLKYDDAEEQK